MKIACHCHRGGNGKSRNRLSSGRAKKWRCLGLCAAAVPDAVRGGAKARIQITGRAPSAARATGNKFEHLQEENRLMADVLSVCVQELAFLPAF